MIFFALLSLTLSTHAQETERDPNPISAAETGDADPFQAVTFGNGIQFSHPENKLQVNLRFRMQNRMDFQADRFEWQVRRLRMRFGGFVLDPKLTYNLQLSFSRSDMDWANTQWPNMIRDAMIVYALSPQFSLAMGQGKLPGNRQRVVSSGDLQFVDRSVVNAEFNLDRDFGVQVQLQTAPGSSWAGNLKLAIASGEGRNLPVASDSGLGYVARAEWLPFGHFDRNGDYFESDLAWEPELKASFAVGGAFFRQSNRAGGAIGSVFTTTGNPNSGQPIRRDQSLLFSDFILKRQGWSLSAEWLKRMALDPVISSSQAILVGEGLNIQLGKMWGRYWETALRASQIWVAPISEPIHRDQKQGAFVVSRFFQGHRVKLQSEITHASIESRTSAWIGRLQFELGI